VVFKDTKLEGTTMRKIRKSTAAAIVGVGALALLATPSFAAGGHSATKTAAPVQLAHMGQGQSDGSSRQPCPMGPKGQAMMGSGMMSPGMMGPGMIGPGMMGPGMIGHGTAGQSMMGPRFGLESRVVPSKDLTAEDVRHFLEHRLEMYGNKRLKVGEVKEADNDKIVADVTTVDDSLVQRLEVDRHSGRMRHVD
jgi:hypothetical protein